ncbi:MAG TPA: four helix bundle protein [Burkholderiales bacterium]|jgi:four helix bundle protein|nr:four helix bundle protein [Burkholderiales bacterium]
MGKQGFRGLLVWQKAKSLAVAVYRLTTNGPLSRDYALRDQMRRAAISICSNIAEGDERDTDKDAVRFFYLAKGSAAELSAQSEIAEAVGHLPQSQADELIQSCEEIGRMLRGLISARSNRLSEPDA